MHTLRGKAPQRPDPWGGRRSSFRSLIGGAGCSAVFRGALGCGCSAFAAVSFPCRCISSVGGMALVAMQLRRFRVIMLLGRFGVGATDAKPTATPRASRKTTGNETTTKQRMPNAAKPKPSPNQVLEGLSGPWALWPRVAGRIVSYETAGNSLPVGKFPRPNTEPVTIRYNETAENPTRGYNLAPKKYSRVPPTHQPPVKRSFWRFSPAPTFPHGGKISVAS